MNEIMADDWRMLDLKRRMESLEGVYGGKVARKSILSVRGGAGVLPKILGAGGYSCALEIGTFRGVGAAALSMYCDRVITIDLKNGKLEGMGESWDRWAFWDKLGRKNIELFLVDDDREKAEIVNKLRFDFALIDGAHDATVRNDFALVKRCGAVLFHDYDTRGQKALDYVYDFVNTLPKNQLEIMDIFALWKAR